MIWPFRKKTDPFVAHIVQSLATDPGSWTLEETKVVDRWLDCKQGEPEARKSDRTIWSYSNFYHVYERPVWRPVFRLKHVGGTIILCDKDARSYDGWGIEVPAHVQVSDADSATLSRAVKAWRENALAQDLLKHTPEQKLLSEAMSELEDEMRMK